MGAKIGMSIQNIGSDMTFLNEKVKMPTFFRVGGSLNVLQRGDSRSSRRRSSRILPTTLKK